MLGQTVKFHQLHKQEAQAAAGSKSQGSVTTKADDQR
jgi:hypothetical protein